MKTIRFVQPVLDAAFPVFIFACALAAVPSVSSAQSDDGAVVAPGATARTSLPQRWGALIRDAQISLFSWGYGPGVQNPSGNSVAINGADTRDAGNWITFNITAPAFGRWRLSVVPGFASIPSRPQGALQLMNPTMGLQGEVYGDGEFSYFVRGETVFPVSETSRNDKLIAGPQMLNVLSYRAMGSKWAFQQVLLPGMSFFRGGDSSGFLYLNPMISYFLYPTVQLTLLSEHFLGRRRADDISMVRRTDPDFVGLGFRKTFNLTQSQNFFVHPYLNVYPGRLSWDNTHFALLFGGRLL